MSCTHRPLPLFILLLAACSAGDSVSDPWMAPAQVGGKADAIATLSGEDIPSDFVDEDASYLHDRSIQALADVGGLAATRLSLATRADGIIDALPADGRLDVEELVRMEESPYFDLLFPEEQEALPTLWPLLEVPETPTETLTFDDLEPLEVDERSVEPGALSLPDWLTIAEFSEGVRDALRRMELGFDDDADDNTVSLDDIDGALDNPGAFTPAEIADIADARDQFLARGESLLSAVTGVPTPGDVVDEASVGAITFESSARTVITERRSETDWNDRHSQSYSVNIDVERDTLAWPQLADGQQLLVIESLQERDQVLGAEIRSLSAGVYLVELWHDGERQDVVWAELPDLGEAFARLEIDERVGHALETFDGTPLQRNIRDAESRWSQWYVQSWANYTWDAGHEEPTGDVDNAVVSRLAVPRTSLAPGRYAVEDENASPILLDVFPEGALRATYHGHTEWMYLHSNGSSAEWARRYTAITGDRHVHFQVAEDRLHAWRNFSSGTHYYANVELQDTDREG